MVKSGSINGVNFGYQKKSVKPTIRVGKSETAGKLGTAIDQMGAGGIDITLDVIAQSITERDSLIAAFMQEGRGKLKPGTPDNDWYFSGVCVDYSTDYALSQYNPSVAYPLSFLFETDLPYLISDKVTTIGKQITTAGEEWISADAIAFNQVHNSGFEQTDTTEDYTKFNNWEIVSVSQQTESLTQQTSTVDVGTNPVGVAICGGTNVIVTNYGSNTITSFVAANPTQKSTVNVGTNPWGVTVNSAGTRAYVSNAGSNNVSVIQIPAYTVIATIPVGTRPQGVLVSSDSSKVYVANLNSNSISVISTSTNQVSATISSIPSPIKLTFSPMGSRLYAANLNSNTVTAILLSNNSIETTINVGTNPRDVVTITGKLYVANSGSNNVTVINTANAPTYTVTKTITVGTFPIGITASADGKYVFVTNQNSNTVSVINTTTDTVVGTIDVGTHPYSMVASATKLYVANFDSNNVSVISPLPVILPEIFQSTNHKYGSNCLKLVNNNGLTKFGEQTQPQNFESDVEYTIGFYGYIENPSGSEIVLELKNGSSVLNSLRSSATGDFALSTFTYTFSSVPTNAVIFIYGSGNASATTNHYIDAVFCMKSSDYPDSLVGSFITTGDLGGTVDSIPDIQIDSLNVANPMYNKLDETIYTHSTFTTTEIRNDSVMSYTPPLSDLTVREPEPITDGGPGSTGSTVAKSFSITPNVSGTIYEIGFHIVGGHSYEYDYYNPSRTEILGNSYTSPSDIVSSNLNLPMSGMTSLRILISFYYEYITISNCYYKYTVAEDYYLLKTIVVPSVSGKANNVTSISYQGYTSNSTDAVRFKVTIQKGSASEVEKDNWTTTTTSSSPGSRSLTNLNESGNLNEDITIRFYGKFNLVTHTSTSSFSILNCAVSYSTSAPYTLLNSITVPATVSLSNNILEVGFAVKTTTSTNPIDVKASIQHSTGSETYLTPTFTTASDTWVTNVYSNLNSSGNTNTSSTIRFYGQLETGLQAILSLKDCYVNYLAGTASLSSTPQNVYIYNTADKFTKCNVCNTLLKGSSLRIKQDGTGHFSYFDNYLTNLYQNIVSSKTNVTWSTGRITIDATVTQGEISYTFDVRYPIDGIPVLILNVISGNPQIRIAVNEAGTTGQLYYIDENSSVIQAGSHLWNLYNLANCNLSESTNITIQILPRGGESCVIGSFFFWTATITVDAELPKIFKDKINTFRVDMSEDALCLISLGIHDYKWGI